MSVVLDRFGRNAWRHILAAAVLCAAMTPASAQNDHARSLTLTIDQAQTIRLPDNVATLVVGNPLIADVSIQAGGMAVLTAKGYGATNLVAMDRSGAVLDEKTILVQGSRDTVTVYRGVERESYSCAPKCERRITLGDGAEFFGATIGQTTARNGQAQGAATQSK